MTDRRQPPRPLADRRNATPALGPARVPAVSGEFRAVRPEISGPSSSSLRAVREAPGAPPSRGSLCRFPKVQMPAVEGPPSGRMLDDALSFEIDIDAGGALELDCLPSSHLPRVEQPRQPRHEPPPVSRPMGRSMDQTASSQRAAATPQSAPRRASSSHEAVDTRAAFAAFAGFGEPPSGILGTPGYAWRVFMRRRVLEADLARARLRRSPDVSLYEASLRTADRGAFRKGMAGWALVLALGALVIGAALHLAAGPLLSLL